VMNDLLRYGEVKRGYVGGLQTVSVTDALAQELGLASTRGALVWRMSRASAAYDAGLRPGDLIETFNGARVDDANHFLRLLADAEIGSTVTLGVRRDRERLEVKIQVSKMPRSQRG